MEEEEYTSADAVCRSPFCENAGIPIPLPVEVDAWQCGACGGAIEKPPITTTTPNQPEDEDGTD